MGLVDILRNAFSSGTEKPKEILTEELYAAGSVDGFDLLGWFGLLPDPDPVLRKRGDGVRVLRELLGDDKVIASIQNRKLGTLRKSDYVLEPGAMDGQEPEKAATALCKDMERDLERVDLYNVFSQVLDAPYFGFTPVEILWRAEGGRLRIHDLKPRPNEWFGWNGRHEPLFIGNGTEQAIPDNKVVIARHFPDAVNPYGLRLLSRCLWPVAIKKGGIKFWTVLCERFGIPWVIGKTRPGADQTERSAIASALARMVQDAVAVVSSGTEIEVKGIESRGGELHPKLVEYCDSSIARALMGQTLTSEVGDHGSYAAAKTHGDVLGVYQEADETIVSMFMNDLAWVYGQVNDRNVMTPVFRYREPDDYASQAELDTKLYGQGVRFTKNHYVRRYRLAEDEFDITAETAPVEKENQEQNEFASPGGFTPDQQAIEDMIDEVMPEAEAAMGEITGRVMEAVEAAESYEDLQALLAEVLADHAGGEQLRDLMQRLMVAGWKWGEYNA